MAQPETALPPTPDAGADLVLALLRVDERLGNCEEDFRRVRQDLQIRRAVAERLVQPQIHRHRLVIDYDDPTLRELDQSEYHHVDPDLQPHLLPIDRTGRHETEIVEIYADRMLSTFQQLELIRFLGYRRLCRARAKRALDTVLSAADYPIMAHCGQPFTLGDSVTAVPGMIQVNARRMLAACRHHHRWSQEFRLLAAPPA